MKNNTLIFLSERVIIIEPKGNIKIRQYQDLDVNVKENSFDFTSNSDGKRYVGKPGENKVILNLLDDTQIIPTDCDTNVTDIIEAINKADDAVNKYIFK